MNQKQIKKYMNTQHQQAMTNKKFARAEAKPTSSIDLIVKFTLRQNI